MTIFSKNIANYLKNKTTGESLRFVGKFQYSSISVLSRITGSRPEYLKKKLLESGLFKIIRIPDIKEGIVVLTDLGKIAAQQKVGRVVSRERKNKPRVEHVAHTLSAQLIARHIESAYSDNIIFSESEFEAQNLSFFRRPDLLCQGCSGICAIEVELTQKSTKAICEALYSAMRDIQAKNYDYSVWIFVSQGCADFYKNTLYKMAIDRWRADRDLLQFQRDSEERLINLIRVLKSKFYFRSWNDILKGI